MGVDRPVAEQQGKEGGRKFLEDTVGDRPKILTALQKRAEDLDVKLRFCCRSMRETIPINRGQSSRMRRR